MISLNYRVRDFIDYIFYSFKWPNSKLRIKRFISRTVILEAIIMIPEDRLINFSESINFNGSCFVNHNIDLFKFNEFYHDINYVIFKMVNSILNKSLFYLLMRCLRAGNALVSSYIRLLYRKLFSIISYNELFCTKMYGYQYINNAYKCLYNFNKKYLFKNKYFFMIKKYRRFVNVPIHLS